MTIAPSSIPPRVLVIPASYYARNRVVGGGERYALEYARALAKLAPTTLGLFDLQGRVEQQEELTIRTFTARRLSQRLGFPMTAASSRALREFDVIHIMVFPTPLADWLLLASRFRKQLVILTDVGGCGPCWSSYLEKFHSSLNLNRRADGLAHLSRHASRFYRDWKQPQTTLFGGVDLDQYAGLDTTPQGYALFVGRLLPHKGVLPVIEALTAETPLRVLGRPYDEAYVRELQAAARGKNVTFIFDADDRELRRQYAGANVVLQPSLPAKGLEDDKAELLGLVALEAMGAGKPVIVTRTTSLPELVVDGKTGYIIQPGDAVDLRRRVEQLVQNPALSEEMGRAARQHIVDRFTWEKVARRGADFYKELRFPPTTGLD
jgi:glycosyltransferase involved in cell wall biosynthesis